MAKKHRNRKHHSPRRTATRRSSGSGPARSRVPHAVQEPLLGPLRQALREPDPTAFWVMSAPVVHLVDEPGELADALPEGLDLLQSFIEVDLAETTALLHMVAALSRDEMTRARASRAAQTRRQPVPPHVSGLRQATVTGTRVFGDLAGDNHLVELTLPGQVRATLMAYVERRPHLYLKDAFFIGERLERVEERYAEIMLARDVYLEDIVRTLDPGQTRAALERALAGADAATVTKPEEEGDQWPMCRPLVHFALSLLPEGGAGYDEHGLLIGQDPSRLLVGPGYPEIDVSFDESDLARPWFGEDEQDPPWVDEDGTDLLEAFQDSTQASDLSRDEETAMLAALLMSFAAFTEDDPLHWCPEMVHWVLEDLLPVDPNISEGALDQVGVVLPALVTWAHERTGTDPAATEMLRREMAPLLADLPARRSDPRVRVARLDVWVGSALRGEDLRVQRRALLAQRVGGEAELDGLGTDPLPAEPLVLDEVPADLHGRLVEIDQALVTGLEAVGEEMLPVTERTLDEEFVTACRRFLVQAAVGDPEVLRRRASTRTTAAAVAWTVGRGNDLVGTQPAPVRTGELMRAFRVNTPTSRAESLQEAAILPHAPDGVALGGPALLVASARRSIVADRDQLVEDEPLVEDQDGRARPW